MTEKKKKRTIVKNGIGDLLVMIPLIDLNYYLLCGRLIQSFGKPPSVCFKGHLELTADSLRLESIFGQNNNMFTWRLNTKKVTIPLFYICRTWHV